MTTEADKRLTNFSLALAFRAGSLTNFAPECVYHYTTAPGFAGILHDRAIRATNFSFLNDPTEVSFGRRVVEEQIARLVQAATPPIREFLNEVSRQLTIETVAEVYVTSFTALDDDLSQWRAYGMSFPERYAIGFYAPTLIDLAAKLPNAAYAKVLYKPHEQRDRVTSLLQKAVEHIVGDAPQSSDLLIYALVTAKHLVRVMPVLKDPAYAREEEWRLVMWHRKEDPSPSIDSTRGVLRPYLPFVFGVDLPIVDVNILAPTRREAALKAASLLLQSKSVHAVPRHSSVPFAD